MNSFNPQQMAMQMLGSNNSPLARNLMNMAQNGDVKGIEQIARNMMKEKGLDFDKEFASFRNRFNF